MPVSSPSYFPPQRGNFSIIGITAGVNALGSRDFLAGQNAGKNTAPGVDDLIVIGYTALSAGTVAAPITDPTLSGTIIVGNGAGVALTLNAGNTLKPSLVIGTGAIAALISSDGNVILGNGAVAGYVGSANFAGTLRSCVMIGQDVAGSMSPQTGVDGTTQDSVIIGRRACFGISPRFSILRSVIIGAQANEQIAGTNASGDNNVVIGYQAGLVLSTGVVDGIDNVILGASSCTGQNNIRECVVIGKSSFAVTGPGPVQARGSVVVGIGSGSFGSGNTLIGANITATSGGNIMIGSSAPVNYPNPANMTVVIGTDAGRFVYGQLNTGNMLIGNSIAGGTILSFGTGAPTNVLKLLNGTVATSAPVGGGYFYVVAGALHWVGSGGTDTVVAPA